MAENRNTLRGIPCHMPDLATRKPKIAAPPGACDTHFHLLSKPFIDNPPYMPPDVGFEGFMPNDADLQDLLALWAPDADLRRKILVDNPAAP